MSMGASFPPASEMIATVETAQENLDQMRGICKKEELPFHLVSEMESTVGVSDKCIKRMTQCYKLSEQLAKLRSYERERNSTMIMLTLARYGSKEAFESTLTEALDELKVELAKLEKYINELGLIVEQKAYSCPECQGNGSISKWEYIRDRGTPTRPILRTFTCDHCEGRGYMTIETKAIGILNLLICKAKELLLSIGKFHNLATGFISTCFPE